MRFFLHILIGLAIGAAIFGASFALYIYLSDRTPTETVLSETEMPTEIPTAQLPARLAIPGEWLWKGVPYYALNSDGTGGINTGQVWQTLRWWEDADILFICDTPEHCQDDCNAPQRWHFQLVGNELTLTLVGNSEWVHTYLRK
jgi:hypothetical protein